MHRYAAHNHKHVWSAVTAIESGNAQMLGSVMVDAQQLFDNCAIEVSESSATVSGVWSE